MNFGGYSISWWGKITRPGEETRDVFTVLKSDLKIIWGPRHSLNMSFLYSGWDITPLASKATWALFPVDSLLLYSTQASGLELEDSVHGRASVPPASIRPGLSGHS